MPARIIITGAHSVVGRSPQTITWVPLLPGSGTEGTRARGWQCTHLSVTLLRGSRILQQSIHVNDLALGTPLMGLDARLAQCLPEEEQ